MHVPDVKSTLRLAVRMLIAIVGAATVPVATVLVATVLVATVPALDPNTSRA